MYILFERLEIEILVNHNLTEIYAGALWLRKDLTKNMGKHPILWSIKHQDFDIVVMEWVKTQKKLQYSLKSSVTSLTQTLQQN